MSDTEREIENEWSSVITVSVILNAANMAEVCGLWGASRMQSPQGGFVFGWWSGKKHAAISSSRLHQLAKLQNMSSVLQSDQ